MTIRNHFLFSIILFLVGSKSFSQFDPIDFENPYLFNSEIQEELRKDTLDLKHQISATKYALKGDYRNALEQWDIAFPGKDQSLSQVQIDSINKEYTLVPALNYIVKESKKHQVVIINEAHHNSSHRVFTTNLLQEMYDNGYTNLGLEALGNGKHLDSLINERGYPVQKSGFYTRDPQFGNLLRTALDIGYTLFPYEQTSAEDGIHREIAQAQNIKMFMDQKSNEKFLIHCGFAHVFEGSMPGWGKAMAGRLHEITGIDPLTINQTKYSERSNPDLNDPMLKALDLKEPMVLLDQKGQPFRYTRLDSYADIAVFHPITQYIHGRPNWILTPEKEYVSLNLQDLNISFPVMVLAYLQYGDIKTAVPVDIMELQNKNQACHLALFRGNYKIVVNNKNEESYSFELKVE